MPTINPVTKKPVTIGDYLKQRGQDAEVEQGGVGVFLQNLRKPKVVESTDVGVIDTKDATAKIADDQRFIEETYPQGRPKTQQEQEIVTEQVPEPQKQPTATFLNQSGQEVQFTQEQLSDPKNRSYLESQGFVMARSDFAVDPSLTTSGAQQEVSQINDEIESLTREFRNYNLEEDPEFQAQAAEIREQFNGLRDEMRQINSARSAAFRTAGLRRGTAQYAGEIQMGIEGEELKQANARMAEINRQERVTLNAARMAFKEENYRGYSRLVDSLKEIRESKRDELENYSEAITNFNNRLRQDREFELRRQEFKMRQIEHTETMKDYVVDEITFYAESGISLDQITDQEKRNLENRAGLLPGTFEAYYSTVQGLKAQQNIQSEIETMANLQSLANSTPDGVTLNIGGNTISGRKKEDITHIEQLDDSGNLTVVGLTENGEIAYKRVIPNIGKVTPTRSTEYTFYSGSQKLMLDPKEAAKINREVASSDDYKGVLKADGVQNTLQNLERLFKEHGNQRFGKEATEMKSAYTATLLELKELFNLGVLNGPDLTLMEEVLLNPTEKFGLLLKGGEAGVQAGIDQTKELLLTRIEEHYQRTMESYSMYSPEQLTNLKNATKSFNKVMRENAEFLVDKQYERANAETKSLIDQMEEDGATDYEIYRTIKDAQEGFQGNPVSFKNDPDVSKIAQAVGQFESGGNYSAQGPVTKNGDRAYGRYQIMGNNIPSWSREALGRTISIDEFLGSPSIQDQIAEYKMGQYYAQYGTVEDVASMWFSGRPVNVAGNASDVLGTTVPQYVKNVRSIYNKLS